MRLKKITFDNKLDLEFIEKLYIESFPRNERRPIQAMHQLLENEDPFNMFLLETENNTRVGFITYWVLDTFIFLDHFAISPDQRNGGYGHKALKALFDQTELPLIAEIELPETSDLASRRAKFYEKQGFRIWDLPYEQPPYEEGYEPVPMLTVTYRDIGFPATFNTVKAAIYSQIYKQNI